MSPWDVIGWMIVAFIVTFVLIVLFGMAYGVVVTLRDAREAKRKSRRFQEMAQDQGMSGRPEK